ncbi:MAG: sulfatase/phosphatase domain-containing protein, partial [Chloroflexota bacterium]
RTRNKEYKRACHEACIRIPLVAWGGPFRGGLVVDELVSLIDVAPTLLELGGMTPPPAYHGRSLLPLVRGEATDWPEEVFLQISESQVGRAIRTRRWKYGVDAPDRHGWNDLDSDVYVEQYLYDLEADPHEQRNLAGDAAYRAVADALRHTLLRRMAAAGERSAEIWPA